MVDVAKKLSSASEFVIGDKVLWRDEEAIIYSTVIMYRNTKYYDIKLRSTGQLILGVDQDNLHKT